MAGKTPFEISLDPGEYDFALKKDGYITRKETKVIYDTKQEIEFGLPTTKIIGTWNSLRIKHSRS